MPPNYASLKGLVWTLVVGALFVAPGAVAATATIYKCPNPHLGLVYTDQPCQGGTPLDIHPGEADPEATARLAHARDELDRSATARIVDLRRDAARKELAWSLRQQADQDRAASIADAGPVYSSAALQWYPAFLPIHRWHSPRPRHRHSRPTPAPDAPYLVPRS